MRQDFGAEAGLGPPPPRAASPVEVAMGAIPDLAGMEFLAGMDMMIEDGLGPPPSVTAALTGFGCVAI